MMLRKTIQRIPTIACAIVIGLVGCRHGKTGQESLGKTAVIEAPPLEVPEVPEVGPYPPARWRLATQDDLERTVLWVSHILVRHNRVRNAGVSFAPAQWRPSIPLSSRTHDEARKLANRLSHELQSEPGRFGEYARRFSEDLATQTTSGSLGGIDAYQLCPWPQILDALAAVPVGQVTEPIETGYGFHIFQQRPPPAEETVSGSRLVIGYDDARWLHDFHARGNVPFRSRAEAIALAERLYDAARLQPDQFQQLVAQYSDHRDAGLGGDIGEWSSRKSTWYPREVEALSTLRVGEIARPIDSLFGIEVIQRTPNRSRAWYAMDALSAPYEVNVPDTDPASRASALSRAQEWASLLLQDPARFDELRHSYSRGPSLRWKAGPERPEVDRALERLAFGQIAPEPIDAFRQFVVPRRLDPDDVPEPEISLELPEPRDPDVAYVVGLMSAAEARRELESVVVAARSVLSMDEATSARIMSLHSEPWDRSLDLATNQERTAAFRTTQREIAGLLVASAHDRYQKALNSHFERLLLVGGLNIL